MPQSNEQEWEQRIQRGRDRFLVPTYTIKDHFRQPDVPFLVPSYNIGAPTFQRVLVDQAFEGVPPETEE